MTTLIYLSPQGRGTISIGHEPLGRGGEGSVYDMTVTQGGLSGDLVVKIYHDPTEGNREKKIVAMLEAPPASEAVAWPLAILRNQQGQFQGYVMKKLSYDAYRIFYTLTAPKSRLKVADDFDVRYALTGLYNAAKAVESLHRAGHVTGDLNESNFFIGNDASVFIVDTDSAQIKAKDGSIFRCLVGKEEYTAPELVGKRFSEQDRTPSTDSFAFAVLGYQLLMGGAHPTDGIYLGDDDPETGYGKLIQQGVYPSLRRTRSWKAKDIIPVRALPSRVRALMEKALLGSPDQRPTMGLWVSELKDVLSELKACEKVSTHFYDARDGHCEWCNQVFDFWDLSDSHAITPEKLKEKKRQERLERAQEADNAKAEKEAAKAWDVDFDDYSQRRHDYPLVRGVTVLRYRRTNELNTRPSLGLVWKQNPMLAVRCFLNELPGITKFGYTPQGAPTLPQVLMSWVLALLGPLAWYFLTLPHVSTVVENKLFLQEMLPVITFTWIAWAAALLCFVALGVQALGVTRVFLKLKKDYPQGVGQEESWKNILVKVGTLWVVYGPLFLGLLGVFVSFKFLDYTTNLLNKELKRKGGSEGFFSPMASSRYSSY